MRCYRSGIKNEILEVKGERSNNKGRRSSVIAKDTGIKGH